MWPPISMTRRSDDFAHAVFEAVDVFEGQFGGGVAVAVDDRRQDRGVLVDVLGYVGQPFQEQTEDPGDEIVVPDEHVFQMRVPAAR